MPRLKESWTRFLKNESNEYLMLRFGIYFFFFIEFLSSSEYHNSPKLKGTEKYIFGFR